MITVLIAVYNLLPNRDQMRVAWSCKSLLMNTRKCVVVVVDGSSREQYESLSQILPEDVLHLHHPINQFNKPALHNYGISISEGYILCTDADYLFSPDFIEQCEKEIEENALLLCEVGMLRQGKEITGKRLAMWEFSETDYLPNKHDRDADGGCQLMHKSAWERLRGYDENMIGWSAMDNDLHMRAKKAGMNPKWLQPYSILHQWHPVKKWGSGQKEFSLQQSVQNMKLRDAKNRPYNAGSL